MELIPGYRFFTCNKCQHEWKSKTNNIRAWSQEACPVASGLLPGSCGNVWGEIPYHIEAHKEWELDSDGYLIDDEDYG